MQTAPLLFSIKYGWQFYGRRRGKYLKRGKISAFLWFTEKEYGTEIRDDLSKHINETKR